MVIHQSKIEKLITELCPDGVEFKKLGEIAKVGTGSSNGNEGVENGKYPLFVRSKFIKSIDTFEFDEEAILIPGEGGVGEIFHYVNGKYALHQRAYRIHFTTPEVVTKFAYYYLFANFLPYILKKSVNATVKSIRKPMIEDFKIPLPHLDIQQEIVKILDTFTELEAELEAQLEARKMQYEYYRDELLSVESEIEWKELGKITIPTQNIKWKEAGKTYKYIDLASVSREDHGINETIEINSTNAPSRAQKVIRKDDVIFATTRPTLRRFALIDDAYDEQVASTGYCVLRAKKDEVLPKWVYFNIASSRFNAYVEKNQEGSAYPAISDSKVKKYKIPVPPLAEQERIVSILDKFDALVNDISIGLPAELNARRQQYEYYRGKLLTFKEYATQ